MADADRFVVLPLHAVQSSQATFEAAAEIAGKATDSDGRPHVIVQVVGEVRRRPTPNVDIQRYGVAANG